MRVLLIDDDRALLKLLTILLTGQGYTVVSCDDGNKAIEMLRSGPFDLMISDVRMSPVNGMDLLRLAKDECPSMPVILLTAYNTPDTQAESKAHGVFCYFTKPVDTDEFLVTVQRALM